MNNQHRSVKSLNVNASTLQSKDTDWQTESKIEPINLLHLRNQSNPNDTYRLKIEEQKTIFYAPDPENKHEQQF